jgi:hypothetical protein
VQDRSARSARKKLVIYGALLLKQGVIGTD